MNGVTRSSVPLASYWRAAVAAFVLAALTGALFRAGMAWGLSTGLSWTNVRHAHSHLMLFGWATPAIMVLVAASLPRLTGRAATRGLTRAIALTLGLGLLSHPFFALFGYDTVSIGSARVPPAVIVAGANMLAWYAFVIAYARATFRVRRGAALLAWDLGLAVMVLSTLAAWALPLMRPLGLDVERLRPILVHAFLDPFAEGFLPLAVLGAMHAARPRAPGSERPLALVAMAIGAPLSFGLAAPLGSVPDGVRVLSAGAAIVWSLGLAAQLASFVPEVRAPGQALPLVFGGLAAAARVLTGIAPGIDWMAFGGLRLLYLHVLLVGLVSLGLLDVSRDLLGERAVGRVRALQVALPLLIGSLLPFTPLWPHGWGGGAEVAAVTAIVAALAGLSTFASARTVRRRASL